MRSHRWLTVVLTLVLGASPLRASAARVRADSTLATGSVSGVIRSSTGEPIRGANVEVLGTGRRTVADTSGGYALRSLQVGRGTLRFSSASHDPLTLDVVVPPGSDVRVDVVLTAAVASLPTVHIPPQSGSRAAAPNGSAWSVGNGGAWQWQGDVATSAMSTGEPDVFRVLASNPHVSLRPEWSGTFTDRGARSDETLFLVDGIPAWNPVHAVGVLSAISPDIVGGLNLSDGVMSARNGGRLSGVLNVETRERSIESPLASAAVGPAAARLAWGAPFAMGSNTGSLLVALRRSDNGALGTGADPTGATDPWNDGAIVASLANRGTAIRLIALTGSDRLNVASSGTVPLGMSPPAQQVNAPVQVPTTSAAAPGTPLTAAWVTRSVGLTWTQQMSAGSSLATRAWNATFSAAVGANATNGTPSLSSAARQSGLASELTTGSTLWGASVESFQTRYQVTDTDTNSSEPATALDRTVAGTSSRSRAISPAPRPLRAEPLSLGGAPSVVSLYAEHESVLDDGRLTATSGLRATGMTGSALQLEPRLSIADRVTDRITVTAGYGRSHQFIQSLRNPDSPLSTLVGVDFPVPAGVGGIPVASASTITGGVSTQPGSHLHVALDFYKRWSNGLAIPDPSGTSVFAIRGITIASAQSTGVSAAADGDRGPLTWQATYGAGRTVSSLSSRGILPSRGIVQTGTAALGFRFDSATRFRLASWAGDGASNAGQSLFGTDPDRGRLDRDNATVPRAGQQFDPELADQYPFPPYVRVDLGAMHDWRLGTGRGKLELALTLANLFNRSNIAAYFPAVGSTAARALTSAGRSVQVGITWHE